MTELMEHQNNNRLAKYDWVTEDVDEGLRFTDESNSAVKLEMNENLTIRRYTAPWYLFIV